MVSELNKLRPIVICLLIAFLSMIVDIASAPAQQTNFGIIYQGQTVQMGQVIYLPWQNNNSIQLVFSDDNLGCSDILRVSLRIQYSDNHGGTTDTGVISFELTAADNRVPYATTNGGNVTVTWSLNGQGPAQTFTFTIVGYNPPLPAAAVYSYTLGKNGPWYMPRIFWQESNYQQFSGCNGSPFDPNCAYEPNWGPPDGIGIGQLEPQNRFSDSDFWMWQVNIDDVFSSFVPYIVRIGNTHWNNIYTEWQNDVASGLLPPPPPPPPSGGELPFCSFAYNGGGAPWQDAEAITAYNGVDGVRLNNGTLLYPPGYYLEYRHSQNGASGHFYFNTLLDITGKQRSYVGDVCSQPIHTQ